MKKLKFIYAFAVVTALFSASCSSDDNSGTDTQKPTIIINEPTDGRVIHAGDEIHTDIDFMDNVQLASYKIDIHFAGDGHSHKVMHGSEGHQEWAYETSGTLSGKNDNIHLHIDVPEDVEEGHYHFGVYAIDKAGNQNVVWIELDVHNHEDGNHHD